MRRDQPAGFSTVVPRRTVAQSASSSSATNIARAVGAPWPISERSMVTVTVPSGAMASQALGAKGSAAAARGRGRGRGTWIARTRPAPAAVSRNSRRVTSERVAMSRPLRRAVDSGTDALVGAAAADGAGHRLVDIGVGRVGRLGQEGRRGHQLARLAIAALRDVFGHPGAL